MFGNIVPMSNVGTSQVVSGNVLSNNNVGNNDLVIIQDTGSATSQAELINQLQNHITDNQQILIITDDQGQDQCKFGRFFCSFSKASFVSDVIIDKDQDINALLQDGECFSVSQFKDDDSYQGRTDRWSMKWIKTQTHTTTTVLIWTDSIEAKETKAPISFRFTVLSLWRATVGSSSCWITATDSSDCINADHANHTHATGSLNTDPHPT